MLWLFIRDETDLLSLDGRLLHFAPELALRVHLERASNLEYVTADLLSPLAAHRVDITALPFEDESFDVIICVHVLEHVEDDRRAMRELRRVLRPSGWAVVMVPLHGGLSRTLEDPSVRTARERIETYGQADHVRLYGLDYVDRLRESGFDVEIHPYSERLGAERVSRYVLSRERVYVCRPGRGDV